MKELVSPEIKRNPSGLDTKLQVFVEDSWRWEKSDDRTRYAIIGYADTLRFDIQEGLTEQNIAQATEEIRRILSTVEELPSEIPAFDFSVLDLPKTRVEGDAIILMDKNGGRKKLKIDTKDIYREMSPKEFEDYCRQHCSFVGMVGNRFFWKLYVADRSYVEVAMDTETGELISKARIDKHDSQEK
ncbi:MAG TPA: hypothetical protein PK765_07360 [bacterium]|nr:hypothetical protein [bacterium]